MEAKRKNQRSSRYKTHWQGWLTRKQVLWLQAQGNQSESVREALQLLIEIASGNAEVIRKPKIEIQSAFTRAK